jgi:hypothetical protein
MAVRFSSPVIRRAQVPLTREDLDALSQLDSEEGRCMLAGLAGTPTEKLSESAVLHALLDLGLRRVAEARAEAGYAALAADPDYHAHAEAARAHRDRRRRPAWADEP